MSKEYIEREAVIEKCNKLLANVDSCPEQHILGGVKLVRDLILINEETRVPAADVKPVRHGEWKYYTVGVISYRECSICGENSPSGFKTPYCSNCGADMRGGKK